MRHVRLENAENEKVSIKKMSTKKMSSVYVEYSPRWEPQIEPHHYLDALSSSNAADASQHARDVGDSVDSPN